MSWLFCCGGSTAQAQKELQVTVDLSAPIRSHVSPLPPSNADDLNDLAGAFSQQDHQLNEILQKQGRGRRERKETFESQNPQQTTSKTRLNSLEQGKRLNNYLSQAQKLISKKGKSRGNGESNIQSSENSREEDFYGRFTSAGNAALHHTESVQVEKLREKNNSNKLFISQFNENDQFYEELSMNEPKSKAQQRQRAFTNTSSQVSPQIFVPKSTKHESSKRFVLHQFADEEGEQEEEGKQLEEQKTYKPFSSRPSLGGAAGKNKKLEQSKVTRNNKNIKYKNQKTHVENEVRAIGQARNSEPLNLSSDKSPYLADQEEIFPSATSAFSFQPKYFKPSSTTKNLDGLSKNDYSQGGESSHKGSRIFEKSATVLNSARVQKGSQISNTPSYSGSSTIVSNSRNPSIIPKDQKTTSSTFGGNKKVAARNK